ncbi:hypothetical protein GCM10010412_092030 [Nonomuraea recticatena]|uniref:Uncharacterized protein n=1 Tax=Nonomuraea recticatena TaxID=46178 RepID=A0ABP6FP05_9ACTN
MAVVPSAISFDYLEHEFNHKLLGLKGWRIMHRPLRHVRAIAATAIATDEITICARPPTPCPPYGGNGGGWR